MLPADPEKAFKHFEHSREAECPRKPHTFLPAGRSQAQHRRAHRTTSFTTPSEPLHTSMLIPSQNLASSSTKGSRNVLILCFGSDGLGINPSKTTVCRLYRSDHGRLRIVR